MLASIGCKVVFGTYRGVTTAMRPLVPAYLSHRVKKGKEDQARLSERYGYATISRPPGPLIWAHGASVGETLAIMPLLGRLGGRGGLPPAGDVFPEGRQHDSRHLQARRNRLVAHLRRK